MQGRNESQIFQHSLDYTMFNVNWPIFNESEHAAATKEDFAKKSKLETVWRSEGLMREPVTYGLRRIENCLDYTKYDEKCPLFSDPETASIMNYFHVKKSKLETIWRTTNLSSINNYYNSDKIIPDLDTIKMFVNLIPISMDELQLQQVFEEFGRVYSVKLLRDKMTGISKGYCFVIYFSREAALRARQALHNVRILNGMCRPLQMHPADGISRKDRKLFVAKLNRQLNEQDVRKMFEIYGPIRKCKLVRDQAGRSMGYAFVTFETKQSAMVALKERCNLPIVVELPYTFGKKVQKKIEGLLPLLWLE